MKVLGNDIIVEPSITEEELLEKWDKWEKAMESGEKDDDDDIEQLCSGRAMAIGFKTLDDGSRVQLPVNVGDIVYFSNDDAKFVKLEGKFVCIINEFDVACYEPKGERKQSE